MGVLVTGSVAKLDDAKAAATIAAVANVARIDAAFRGAALAPLSGPQMADGGVTCSAQGAMACRLMCRSARGATRMRQVFQVHYSGVSALCASAWSGQVIPCFKFQQSPDVPIDF